MSACVRRPSWSALALSLSLLLVLAFVPSLSHVALADDDVVDDEIEEVSEPLLLEEGFWGDEDELFAEGYNSWTGTLTDGTSKKFHLNDSDDADEWWSVGIATFELAHRSKVDLITIYQPTYQNSGSLTITLTQTDGSYGGEITRKLSSTKKTRLTSGMNDKKVNTESVPAGTYRVKYVYRNAHDWDGKLELEIGIVIRPLYKDVPKSHWAAGVIADAVDKGYLSGYNKTMFGTEDPITRGQVATVLWNMAGRRSAGSNNPFNDVKAGNYYYDAVRWAARAGIVKGFDDGTFKPDQPVTRQQLAVILYNFAVKYKGASSKGDTPLSYVSMSDKDKVAPYAENAVGWCFAKKVLAGSDGKINPGGRATRAEAAKMFVKVAQIVKL